MPKYILCPRCELNYMPDGDPTRKYCDVCLAELKLIDPGLLIPDEEEEEEGDQILCPKCKANYISSDEEMCESCREASLKVVDELEPAEEWAEFADPDETFVDDEAEPISFDEIAEEEEAGERDETEPFDEEDESFELADYEDINFDEDDDSGEDDDDEEEEE